MQGVSSKSGSDRGSAPALLTDGNFLGTLAAARDLGRHRIEVTLAEAARRTITARSRYVAREVRSPPLAAPQDWVEWMLAFGGREPGHVLFATSDDVCWLVGWHRDEFARRFRLYQPPGAVSYELLNKRRLYEHCRTLGIDQPEQWTVAEALAEPGRLAYPVLLKPRTQAGIRANPKGLVCEGPQALQRMLARAARAFGYQPAMLQYDAHVCELIVQAFHDGPQQHVYSLAGFYAPEHDLYLVRASAKVVQHPMRVGVGLCFESRPVDPSLARQVRALFDRIGYFGPFEVEFIRLPPPADRSLLIDVNPRFYGQMGFEIARGLPIARLCHAAATGDRDTVAALAAQAAQAADRPRRFRDAWLLRLYATTHLLSGNVSPAQWRAWMRWSQDRDDAQDAVLAQDDEGPARRQRWLLADNLVRHPRSTLRRFFIR